MVKVSLATPLTPITAGLNTSVIDGGATMSIEADAVPPVPPSVEVTLPVVLVFRPAVPPVTLTENIQELLGLSVPPERLTTFVPCAAVIVAAPQEPARLFGVA